MCKAKKEGTRCSHGGRLRLTRATNYAEKVQARVDFEMAKYGKLSEKTQSRLDNSNRRLIQAQKVYNSTPEGQQKLRDAIDIEQQRLSNIPTGEKPGSKNAVESSRVKRRINRLTKALREGEKMRESAKANRDLMTLPEGHDQEGQNERTLLSYKAMAEGGETNVRIQKAGLDKIAGQMEKYAEYAKPINLQGWTRENVSISRANGWVEQNTRTGWVENTKAKPSNAVLANGAVRQETRSSMLRMNLPDGTTGEYKLDVHLVKNKDGSFAVEKRKTSASTWTGVGQIDTLPHEPGYYIATKVGAIDRRAQADLQSFKTEAEARRYMKKSMNSATQTMAQEAALTFREATVKRAARPSSQEKLNKVAQVGRHLYSKKNH